MYSFPCCKLYVLKTFSHLGTASQYTDNCYFYMGTLIADAKPP